MASRRLLIVIDGLWVGGTERSTLELLPFLTRGGWETTVVCLRARDEGVESRVRELPVTLKVLRSKNLLGQTRELRSLFATERPHLVHAALFKANLATRLAALGTPIALLNSIVNTPYEPIRFTDPSLRPSRLRWVKRIDSLTARRVDHFHAVSRTARDAAIRDLGIAASRVTVVVRGRDRHRLGEPSERRRSLARKRLGLASDIPVITTVGRQDFQKNQTSLLKALSLLPSEQCRATLLIVGREGSASKEIEAVIQRLNLEARVRLLGHREDVPEILAASDVFAFPSLFEGYPGAIVEAMALGLPVVASDIPAHREIVSHEETGLLVPTESSRDLSRALHRLLASPATSQSMGVLGRSRFLEINSLEKSAQAMLSLYEQASSSDRTGP